MEMKEVWNHVVPPPPVYTCFVIMFATPKSKLQKIKISAKLEELAHRLSLTKGKLVKAYALQQFYLTAAMVNE